MSQEEHEITITKKVANFIKEKRIARGESLRDFSETIYGERGRYEWIRKIEQERGITLKTLETILTALNCTIEIIEH